MKILAVIFILTAIVVSMANGSPIKFNAEISQKEGPTVRQGIDFNVEVKVKGKGGGNFSNRQGIGFYVKDPNSGETFSLSREGMVKLVEEGNGISARIVGGFDAIQTVITVPIQLLSSLGIGMAGGGSALLHGVTLPFRKNIGRKKAREEVTLGLQMAKGACIQVPLTLATLPLSLLGPIAPELLAKIRIDSW